MVAPAGIKGRLLGRFCVRRRLGGRRWSVRCSRCRSTRCRRRRCSRSPPAASAASPRRCARLDVRAGHAGDRRRQRAVIARLIRRADGTAVIASRVMGLRGRPVEPRGRGARRRALRAARLRRLERGQGARVRARGRRARLLQLPRRPLAGAAPAAARPHRLSAAPRGGAAAGSGDPRPGRGPSPRNLT